MFAPWCPGTWALYADATASPHPNATVRKLKEGLTAIGFNDANFRDSRLIRLKMLNHFKTAGYAKNRRKDRIHELND